MRPKPVTISLKDILKNQEIPFLPLGTPLLQVAGEMGPPRGWITDVYAEPVPLVWCYSDGMELHFRPESPYPLDAIRLPAVYETARKFTRLTYQRQIRHDFPFSEASLSDFLRSGLWNLDQVRVGICVDPHSPMLDISIGRLRIQLNNNDPSLDDVLEGLDLGSTITLLNPTCTLRSAYLLSGDPMQDRLSPTGWTTINAREYLQLLNHKG